MNRLLFHHLIVFFLLTTYAYAQAFTGVSLTAAVTPEAATVGDLLKYEITVTANEEDSRLIKFPLSLKEPGIFEVIDVSRVLEGDTIRKIIFTLAVFETGRQKLPLYSIGWIDSSGAPQSVYTEPVFVEIISVLKPGRQEPELLDIRAVAEANPDWTGYVLPAAILLALLAVIAAAAWQMKKIAARRKKGPVKTATPVELALSRLTELEGKNLPRGNTRGRLKEYFTEISDTLRGYLFMEFSVDAPEKTTVELARDWPAIIGRQRGEVIALLEQCDSVKFAKYLPAAAEASTALEKARGFVILSARLNAPVMEPACEKVAENVTA